MIRSLRVKATSWLIVGLAFVVRVGNQNPAILIGECSISVGPESQRATGEWLNLTIADERDGSEIALNLRRFFFGRFICLLLFGFLCDLLIVVIAPTP